MRTISLIIVHCSATKENQNVTAKDITRWHQERGYYCCGYHYVVERDGTVHNTRPISSTGAHCKGHNKNSIGVCYIGGLDKDGIATDTRTLAQCESMRTLLEELHAKFPHAIILGHRDLSPDLNGDGRISPNEFIKQCPCLDAVLEYQDLQPEGFWDFDPIY